VAALRSGCLKITSFDKQCLWQTFFKGAVVSCKNYYYGNGLQSRIGITLGKFHRSSIENVT